MAFILLGVTCFAIASHATRCKSWRVLGAFGLIHGASEWLDLLALVVGDNTAFAAIRTAVMAGSYMLLMEFGRRELKLQHNWVPGAWIYAPLALLVVACGVAQGVPEANAVARYAIGFIGALGVSFTFVVLSKGFSGSARRLAIITSVAFALYGIAAGVIVPAAPFWPADVINQEGFLRATGVPIQFVRGVLACTAAVAIWGIWGQKLMLEVSSQRYSMFLRKQFLATIGIMASILFFGWLLTEYFGIVHKRNLMHETRGDLALIATSLEGETAPVDAVVRSLAGALSLSSTGSQEDPATAKATSLLALSVEASGAESGYLLAPTGAIVVASGARPGDPQNVAEVPCFERSLAGHAGRYFSYNALSKRPDYCTSYPVFGTSGNVAGVVILIRSLKGFEHKLQTFNNPYFLIDPLGNVALTNRPDLSPDTIKLEPDGTRAPNSASKAPSPLMATDGTWATVDGVPMYMRQHAIGETDWSLVIFVPIEGIFASRVLGIAITLLATIMVLIYIVARERAVHDHIQMDRRLELEELARILDHKATTDPLTGLSNRLKFDEALSAEITRCQRYDTPLSLILYDIDHFKEVNDRCGHQVGDAVLISLSRCVAERTRATDLLARWGGEEFAILLPHSDARMAAQFATILRDSVAILSFKRAGSITCSFGVAQFAGEDAESFVARADEALYRAKLNGRNRVELAVTSAAGKSGFGSAA